MGSMDLDTIIRALYLIGYNTEGRYVTPEPLGPGGDPYPAMNGKPDPESAGRAGAADGALLPRAGGGGAGGKLSRLHQRLGEQPPASALFL